MSESEKSPERIHYRLATPDDAEQAGELIFETFPKLATYVFGLGDEPRAKKLLTDIFPQPGHRFSYEFSEMVLHQDQVTGILITYPGSDLTKLNLRLGRELVKQYSFCEKFRLLTRGMQLIFINEAAVDEYLLSNLAVEATDRGQGAGTQILTYFENKVKNEGFGKVSLMVELDNTAAQRFYERSGYHVTAKHLVAEKHQHALGAGYLRMVKELDE